jgi:hypothetical protein
MTALCWLNWVLKHRFDRTVQDACACSAARLPLIALEKHRQMMTEKLLGKSQLINFARYLLV